MGFLRVASGKVVDAAGEEVVLLRYRQESFALLDQLLDWCRGQGVIDMHLAPGKQNPHDFVVHRQNQARFWLEPENQERFYALWVELARRYSEHRIILIRGQLRRWRQPRAAAAITMRAQASASESA